MTKSILASFLKALPFLGIGGCFASPCPAVWMPTKESLLEDACRFLKVSLPLVFGPPLSTPFGEGPLLLDLLPSF